MALFAEFPPEWAAHKATWLAWPDLAREWKENHEGARQEFLNLCRTIALAGKNPTETLNIFIKSSEEKKRVSEELKGLDVNFYIFEYGDIWLRDTACVFSGSAQTKKSAHVFRFNGWGGKYLLGKDAELADEVAKISGQASALEIIHHPFVFEGGAFDHNGQGLWVTTSQCLLNPNRNPGMTRSDYESQFRLLGAKDICWISEGLLNDHTDGHVDNILRFANEKTLVCMESCGSYDPHREKILTIQDEAKAWAAKHGLDLIQVKSPGEVEGPEGEAMPASYMNFYITNNSVAVPLYGTSQDAAALETLQKLFPTKKVEGLASNHILSGGGSFHCITQQEPQ